MIIGIISALMFLFGPALAIIKIENDILRWVGYLITMLSIFGMYIFIINVV